MRRNGELFVKKFVVFCSTLPLVNANSIGKSGSLVAIKRPRAINDPPKISNGPSLMRARVFYSLPIYSVFQACDGPEVFMLSFRILPAGVKEEFSETKAGKLEDVSFIKRHLFTWLMILGYIIMTCNCNQIAIFERLQYCCSTGLECNSLDIVSMTEAEMAHSLWSARFGVATV